MADTQRLPKIKSEDIDNRIALATLGAESMDSSSNGAAATTVGAGRKRKAVGEHEGRPAPPSNTTATTTSATTIAATLAPPNIPDPPRGTLPPLPELQLSLQTMTFRHSGWGPGRDNQVLALQGAAALSLAAVELILEKDFLSLKGALNALREKLVNQKTLAVLAQKYDLVNRLVPPPNSQPSLILASTTARVAVFQAYIAAIRRQYGYEIMLDFLRDLYSSGEWEKAYSVDADVL